MHFCQRSAISKILIWLCKLASSTNWGLLPWHSLYEPFAKMIKGNGDLHVLVLRIRVTVPQKHDLVMMSHVVVGDGDGRGSMYGVYESVTAIRKRTMVDPDVPTAKDGHTITV